MTSRKQPRRNAGMRHVRSRRSHRVAHGMAVTLTATLAFGVAAAATVYERIHGNLNIVDTSGLVVAAPTASDGPTAAPDPSDNDAGRSLNILLIGSDTRDGSNAALGGVDGGGERSDTTIVAHISADRTRVDMVSIPRDSLVDVPGCIIGENKTSRPYHGMFNSAFSTGADQGGDLAHAVACTQSTIQVNTGLTIDYFVVIDFLGLVNVVDALGGVPICIPEAIDSPKAQLKLAAGNQVLTGTQALGYARARTGKGLGDGSDTMRVGRQQRLLAATVNEVKSKNYLTDAMQLTNFLSAAAGSMSVDPKLGDIRTMAGLGLSLKNVPLSNVNFMTIPFATAKSDRNRVEWTADADRVWSNLLNDLPMSTGDPAATPTPVTPPAGGAPAAPGAPTGTPAPVAPAPVVTKTPGKDAFSASDITGTCG